MKHNVKIIRIAAIVILLSGSIVHAFHGPFDGKNFKGRIAFSSDGNFNDEDDWGAFPVAAAILDVFGVTDKLVHVDYSNILAENDTRFHREMTESVLGSAERYNIPRSILFDCQEDFDGAVESIKNAINASSQDDPLYYVLAGPMEVPYLGIEKSDPAKRRYVYCISHSRWNDGYTSSDRSLHNRNKRDVIPSGINWIQVKDGNRNLAHPGGVGRKSTPEQWRLYHWLRDSSDDRLRWIFTRLEAEQRADISDSTMTYFLLTGDEDADLTKLKSLLDDKILPAPMHPRDNVRIEAENFLALDNFRIDSRKDRSASHRLSVRLAGRGRGSISTPFNQPYTAESDSYDIDIRYFNAKEGQCRLVLLVNGNVQGDAWLAAENNDKWTTKTIPDVAVNSGDEIKVVARSRRSGYTKLDYVQFNRKVAPSEAKLDDPAALPGPRFSLRPG